MEVLANFIFSNTEALTPLGIQEFFVACLVLEFVGMTYSWIKGVE